MADIDSSSMNRNGDAQTGKGKPLPDKPLPAASHLLPSRSGDVTWTVLCLATFGLAAAAGSRFPSLRARVQRRKSEVDWPAILLGIDWARADLNQGQRRQLLGLAPDKGKGSSSAANSPDPALGSAGSEDTDDTAAAPNAVATDNDKTAFAVAAALEAAQAAGVAVSQTPADLWDRAAWDRARWDDNALGGSKARSELLGWVIAGPKGQEREVPVHLLLVPAVGNVHASVKVGPGSRYRIVFAYELDGQLFIRDPADVEWTLYNSELFDGQHEDEHNVSEHGGEHGGAATSQSRFVELSPADGEFGLSSLAVVARFLLAGPSPPTIPESTLLALILRNLVRPMYVFQVLSTAVWLIEGYWSFAAVIFMIATVGLVWESRVELESHQRARQVVGGSSVGNHRTVDPDLFKTPQPVDVFRAGEWTEVSQETLVPGDLVRLSSLHNRTLHVEAILVHREGETQGTCVVDEASVTGEPVPAGKTSIGLLTATATATAPAAAKLGANAPLEIPGGLSSVGPASILHAGSTLVQCSPEALALVTATANSTPLSRLLHTLLHPRPSTSRIERQATVFLIILTIIGLLLVIKRIVQGFLLHSAPAFTIILTSMDLMTLAVPPALPIVLTLATAVSLRRLSKRGIWGAEGSRMPDAGRIGLIAWDKTGTLTGSEMACFAVVPSGSGAEFSGLVMATAHEVLLVGGGGNSTGEEAGLESMGSGSTYVAVSTTATVPGGRGEQQSKLVGPEVDLAMLRKVGAMLLPATSTQVANANSSTSSTKPTIEPILSIKNVGDIVLRKPFDSATGWSAAVVRTIKADTGEEKYFATFKGSPTSIRELCKFESLPADFDDVVRREGRAGGYLLAMAVREVTDLVLPHGSLAGLDLATSSSATFTGWLVFSSALKPGAQESISELAAAEIKSVIVTGDSAWTAVAVARTSGIIDKLRRCVVVDCENGKDVVGRMFGADEDEAWKGEQLAQLVGYGEVETAVTATAIDVLHTKPESQQLLKKLLDNSRVFARMKPLHKTFLVGYFKLTRPDLAVMFVGDGHNDSGALRSAHVGLSVGKGAALSAPFSSGSGKVSDVVKLIKEGRAALETATGSVKFMIMYPVIQLTVGRGGNEGLPSVRQGWLTIALASSITPQIVSYLQHIRSNLSSNQYFIDDLLLVFSIQLLPLLLLGPTHGKLSIRRPDDSLFSASVITSLAGQIIIWLACFSTAMVVMSQQSWFCSLPRAESMLDPATLLPKDPSLPPSTNYPCYPIDPSDKHSVSWGFVLTSMENTVAWLFGHGQFFICAVAFGVTARFRQPFWRSTWYLAYLALCLGWIVLLFVSSDSLMPSVFSAWAMLFGLVPGVPTAFRIGLMLLFFVDLIAAVWFWESLVVDKFVGGRVWEKWLRRSGEREQTVYVPLEPRGDGAVGGGAPRASGFSLDRPSVEGDAKVEIQVGDDEGEGESGDILYVDDEQGNEAMGGRVPQEDDEARAQETVQGFD